MEDRIIFDNRNFIVKTYIEKSDIHSKIYEEKDKKLIEFYSFCENNQEEQEVHNKALLYLFDDIQKSQKISKIKKQNPIEKTQDNFGIFCKKNIFDNSIYAVFLLKDKHLYSYHKDTKVKITKKKYYHILSLFKIINLSMY
jgi:hypothetical protein